MLLKSSLNSARFQEEAQRSCNRHEPPRSHELAELIGVSDRLEKRLQLTELNRPRSPDQRPEHGNWQQYFGVGIEVVSPPQRTVFLVHAAVTAECHQVLVLFEESGG